MEGSPSKRVDDDRPLVRERVGDVTESSEQGEQPRLGVRQSLDHLLLLERLVLYTGLVPSDPEDRFDALLRGEEPGIRRGIGEQEPVKDRDHSRYQTGDDHEPVDNNRSVAGPPRKLIGYTISKERNPWTLCVEYQKR